MNTDNKKWSTEQYIDYSNVSAKAKKVWQTKAGMLIKKLLIGIL